MRISLLIFGVLVIVKGQKEDEEWIDPTDMLNYDASSKTMRRPGEPSNYENVPTKRKEYISDPNQPASCPDVSECSNKLAVLERKVEACKKKVEAPPTQSVCHPVFKRYLNKLLKDIQKLGLPDEVGHDVHYDADVLLTRQAVSEIRKFLSDESWKPGVIDEALSQILINFKPHDYEAWKWSFEETFGVELATLLQLLAVSALIVFIICTELWTQISWMAQFRRMFIICFMVSIVWNWLYLYKTAFADHQSNIVKMEAFNDKCSGIKKIDWMDNLKEWYRSTWTLQDDPCKKYYELVFVDPILLVSPVKAISVTFASLITEPCKQVGQGISDFLRALLKDLPITLQIPVLITIVLSMLVFLYGSAQAVIQNVVSWRPLGHHDPRPPALLHNVPQGGNAIQDMQAGGDAGLRGEVDMIQHNKDKHGAQLRRRNQNRNRRYGKAIEGVGPTDRPIKLFPQDEVEGEVLDDLPGQKDNPNENTAAAEPSSIRKEKLKGKREGSSQRDQTNSNSGAKDEKKSEDVGIPGEVDGTQLPHSNVDSGSGNADIIEGVGATGRSNEQFEDLSGQEDENTAAAPVDTQQENKIKDKLKKKREDITQRSTSEVKDEKKRKGSDEESMEPPQTEENSNVSTDSQQDNSGSEDGKVKLPTQETQPHC
ncbi:chloride channel CLIC-like protein 1 isoform X1 [Acipenser ruthenus]|uniref:chloride channel CLIC-like protein 1 isoform X1 n=1 Tax=Acipenser ruthenus TaxID=7906 RepID=UPI0027412F57|nr:chloride channel CLIC-like protein 1 isoform X1 [Acipenser ruthenus]XP_058887742.1 chloride channel CLIC-like protein 1 isoform X1 [Acipenser ruthenus]XP_058887743.1 chloride channel CLIC-like protein 1 isoform X1 [Acipenser ruthenus]XP_058887744.1 chloride channel CLIC-like protein 1 isoform X1 [Acipenser ruthenus]